MIGCDFNERAACEFRLDGMQGHASETQARAQESQLGAEVRKAPNFLDISGGTPLTSRHILGSICEIWMCSRGQGLVSARVDRKRCFGETTMTP